MRLIVWLIRVVIFVAFFLLALANTQDAVLNLFAGRSWHAPQIVIGLIFFLVGAVAGLLALLPKVLRQRREIARLRRALRHAAEANETPGISDIPPLPPVM